MVPLVFFASKHIIDDMNLTLSIKNRLTNYIALCNVVLVLFLSVSFINVAQARDSSSLEKVIFVADFANIADNANELDSGADDNVGITNEVTQKMGILLNTSSVQAKAIFCLDHNYLRPHTRAPPKVFI
jgi:hypothetical protein